MSAAPEPLTAEELSAPWTGAAATADAEVQRLYRLCQRAAESATAKDAEIAALRTALADAGRAMDAAIAGIAALRQRAELAEADAGQVK